MRLPRINSFIDRLEIFMREPMNSLTHWAGALLSTVGLILMLWYTNSDNWVAIMSMWIFGLSMIFLYTSSAVYHMAKASEKALEWYRRVDHMMIYVLIAGSYTPICLLVLDQPKGWIVFSVVWSVAAVGILMKIFWMDAPRWLSTMFYLAMGWAGVFVFPDMYRNLDHGAVVWISLSGLFYTIGAVIYALEKPDPLPRILGFHEIWHLFVLSASFCHFWMVYWYITPLT